MFDFFLFFSLDCFVGIFYGGIVLGEVVSKFD